MTAIAFFPPKKRRFARAHYLNKLENSTRSRTCLSVQIGVSDVDKKATQVKSSSLNEYPLTSQFSLKFRHFFLKLKSKDK